MSDIISGLKIERNDFSAFSLIEVMAVIGMMAIMAAVLVASFGTGRADREIEANGREFAAIIREAQNYALTGRQSNTGRNASYYQVYWIPTLSQYKLRACFKNDSGSCDISELSVYTLRNGVEFEGLTNNIRFSPPFAEPENIPDNPGYRGVVFTKASRVGVVCTYKKGLIKEYKNTSTCPDTP